MTKREFANTVWLRLTKGRSQKATGVFRSSLESIIPAALQRLADRVSADDALYTLLYRTYTGLTLDGTGAVTITGQSPTPLLSIAARKHWRVTMTGVRFSLQFLPDLHHLSNPPQLLDRYFYTIFAGQITVRDGSGNIVPETDLQWATSFVPALITDVNDQLTDNLVDIGEALALAGAVPNEILRAAATMSSEPTPAPAA